MKQPKRWSDEEIAQDTAAAIEVFRRTRFAEPLEQWLREVERRRSEFERLFDEFDIGDPHRLTAADIPAIIGARLLDALRYIPGPPISADDLKNLSDVTTLAKTPLARDLQSAQRVLDTIRQTVDPKRFPWLVKNRRPTAEERSIAIFSSALLLAAQRLQTARRTIAKDDQERAVRQYMAAHGFELRRLAPITNTGQFPPPGVCSENEVDFGSERADVLSMLWDNRMLAIECKVSNSSVNSYKRVNHDTLAKYHAWKKEFGDNNVIPCAMLSGVYKPGNIVAAQSAGLTIFWSHRIDDLGEFVGATRSR